MQKQTIDSGSKTIKWVLSLIPLVLFTVGILISSGSKEVKVVEQKEIVRPGYEPVPHTYKVDASFSKAWKDGSSWVLIIAGLLISSLGTWVYLTYVQKQLKMESIILIGLLWLGGALAIFIGPLQKWGSSSYSSTLNPDEYEKYKGDLDAIFPAIESKEK